MKTQLIKIMMIAVALMIAPQLFAQNFPVWTGALSTDWNTSGNWNPAIVPSGISRVTVPSGTTRALNITSGQTTLTAYNITVNTGATVTIAGNVSITDSLNVNGTITGAGTITLSGTAIQYVKGTLCGLTNSNTVAANASGNLVINGALTNNALLNMGVYTLSGTLTGLSNNSEVRTANTSANPLPSGKGWNNFVTYNATTGGQTIVSGSYTHLILQNSSGTQTAGGDISVDQNFVIPTGSTLNMQTYALAGNITAPGISGTLKTANTSATPIPVNRSWGGTIEYSSASAQTVVSGSYTNLNLTGGNLTLSSTGNINISGTFTRGAGSLTVTGSTVVFNGTTQTVPASTYNNLTINSGTKSAGGDLVVNGALVNNGTLNMGSYVLSGTLSGLSNNGEVQTANTSANPLPSGKGWGSWVTYNSPTGGQTVANGSYIHLNLTNTSGTQTANGNINIDQRFLIPTGGTLDMQNYTLGGQITSPEVAGTLKTANTSSTPIPTGKIWPGTINYTAATGGQTISAASYNNLTISNTSGTQTPVVNLVVNGTLTTAAGGRLDLGTNTLSGTLGTITNNGTIKTSNTTSAPLASGKIWGGTGTVQYGVTTGGQTIVNGTYNNIQLSNSSGTHTASGNIGLNGSLVVQSGGTFDMTTYQLTGSSGTIFNSGTIKTANTTNPPLPNGKTWGGTVNYTSTSGGQYIAGGTFNIITLGNTSGTQTASSDITMSNGGSITVPASTALDLNAYVLSESGTATFTNNGTINTANTSATPIPVGKIWGGTVNYNLAAGGQGVSSGTYNNLTLSNTSGTQTASGNITVNGTLTTTTGGTLSMGTGVLSGTISTITNNGTISTANTSGTPIPAGRTWGGTINFNTPAGGQTISTTSTYNNLTMGNTSGTQTPAGSLTVNGTLTTTSGGTLDIGTNTFAGTLTSINNNGTISTSNSTATPLPSGKTWGGTGTVQYAITTGGQTVVSGTYNNLLLSNTSGTHTASGNIVLNGTLTVQSGGTFDLATNQFTGTSATISNSGTIKTANTSGTPALPAGKTWGGIVNYYASTGGQNVAGGTYNDLGLLHNTGTQTANGDITVNGAFSLPSATMDMSSYQLLGTLSTISMANGSLYTSNTSATPLPAGKTWGGLVAYKNSTGGQTIVSATSYNNLTTSNTSGTQTASGNFAVNGTLTTTAGGTLSMGTGILSGTLSTITNNGTISTANTSATPIPTGKTWGGAVNYNATTGGQTVVSATSYNDLTISNTSGTQASGANLVVNGTLTTTAGGTLSLGTNTLGGTLTTITNNGTISTANTSATPIPTGRTWGGMIDYNAATGGQTVVNAISYTDLSLSNTSGTQTAGGALTINGTITTTAGGTLNMGIYLLSGPMNLVNNGTISTACKPEAFPANRFVGGTVIYAATDGGQTIANNAYTNLTILNSSNTNWAQSALSVSGVFITTAGGTTDMLTTPLFGPMSGGISHNGILRTGCTQSGSIPVGKTWGGTVEYYASTGAQTISDGTYNNLTQSSSSGINTASGNLVVNGTLSVSSGGTLSMSTYTLTGTLTTVNLSGSITTANTSATPVPTGKTWGGTIEYNATSGAQTIMAATYTNLTLSNTSGTQTASGDLVVNGILTTASGGILSLGTGTLTGTLTTITNDGTIKTFKTSSAPLAAGKIWAGNGTVEYAAVTGGQVVSSGTYNGLKISNTNGTDSATGWVKVTNSFTTDPGGIFDLGSNELIGPMSTSILVNGTVKTSNTLNSGFPNNKVWLGSGTIEYSLPAGGQFVATGTFNNLTLKNSSGANTANGNTVVNGTLTTTAGGTMDMGAYTLGGTLTTIVNEGTIRTDNSSSTPLANGKVWGGNGSVMYITATGGQTVSYGTYNNLVLNNASGTNTLNGTTTVNGTLTQSGGQLALGSNTLNINGALSGHSASSSFTANGSSNIAINGSGSLGSILYLDQTTPGTTNRLNNFTYNRSSQTITLGNALQVAGIITPTAGTLATNDQLTLVSNASNTAMIATGSGSYITGNVTAERYIPSIARRWRFMASPVTGSTLADWKNEIFITGTGGAANGFDATLSNAPGVYYYDETLSGDFNTYGWITPSDINTALTPGKGFRVFIRGDRSDAGVLNGTTGTQAAVTMNAIGSVNTGNITMPVTYTNTGAPASDGWNLLGNPYPSPIDWNAFHDAGRTGTSPDYSGTDYAHLDATITTYDPNIANYISYNAVSNTGTGSLSNGIIPSGGAFWVVTTAASPSMTMKETYKTSATPAAMFKEESGPQPVFNLKLSKDAITADEMLVKYIADADKNFDVYDIAKLNGEVNISSLTENGTLLTGNCKPFNGISDSIRLNIAVAESGNYAIEASNVKLLAPGKNVYLVDAFTQTVIDLNITSKYNFTIDRNNAASYGSGRFMIVVGDAKPTTTAIEEVTVAHAVSLYPALTRGEVTISNAEAGNENVSVTITNTAGKEVVALNNLHWNNNTIMLDLSGYKAGAYIIVVHSATGNSVLKCVKYE